MILSIYFLFCMSFLLFFNKLLGIHSLTLKLLFQFDQTCIQVELTIYNSSISNSMGCSFSENQNIDQLLSVQPQSLQLLSSGTHAKVYRMPQSHNNRQYALKVINSLAQNVENDLISKEMSQKFEKIKSITSDQLIHYEHFTLKDHKVSLLMELAPLGTLQEKVASSGRLREDTVSNIAKQIAEGLLSLHRSGLIHKDLKPSNVLIFGEEKIKLSDYCIADIYDTRLRDDRKKEIKGNSSKWNNIPYMAPEVVKNLGATTLSDVWSFGCVVVYMLVGKRPWSELGSESQLFNKVIKKTLPPFPLGITVACQHFLQCCLSVIPSQRSSVQELLDHPFITKAKQFNLQNIPEQVEKNEKVQFQQCLKSEEIRCKLPKNTQIIPRLKTEGQQTLNEKKDDYEFESLSRYNTSGAVILDNNIIKIDGTSTQIKPLPIQFGSNKRPNAQKSPDNGHYVMLNNKKVKLKASLYKDMRPKAFSTEETEWTSPERIKMIAVKQHRQRKNQEQEQGMRFRPSLGIHSGFSRYEEEPINQSGLRILTEPSEELEKDYFKKPLKLIKKKIQQRKAEVSFCEKMSNATRKYSFVQNVDETKERAKMNEISNSSVMGERMRNREESVIDTEVARAERKRFDEIKKLNEKKREELRQKWQFQLNKGKQILKEEPPFCSYLI